jgi:hypothetical protein
MSQVVANAVTVQNRKAGSAKQRDFWPTFRNAGAASAFLAFVDRVAIVSR